MTRRILLLLTALSAMLALAGCTRYVYTSKVMHQSGANLNALLWFQDVLTDDYWLFVEKEIALGLYSLDDVHYAFVSPGTGTFATAGHALVARVGPLKSIQFGTGPTLSTISTRLENQAQAGGFSGEGFAKTFTKERDAVAGTVQAAQVDAVALVRDAGNDGILAWGRWTGEQAKINAVPDPFCCADGRSLHYVLGVATPNANIPQSGTAVFSLMGATSPTRTDGLGGPGQLTSGQVGVVWGGASANTRVGVSLAGTVGGTAFQVVTPGGLAGIARSPIAYNPATRTFSGSWPQVRGGAPDTVTGFFAGPNAERVGLTYSTPLPTGGGAFSNTISIQGAAAFKR